ncbi:MAG: quinone-dependent dihydroorotate dehydrogenase [Calditrichaceae bacterium]
MLYKILVRKIFFLFDPESAHTLLMRLMKIKWISVFLGLVYRFEHPSLNRELFGLTFKNPVGLAAGFDKNAEAVDALEGIGFGFVEIGTVTPKGQPGNPKPRLFRLVDDQGIINRMGFNNDGVEEIARRLKKRKGSVLIGGNIGKNKITPNDQAWQDYEICFNQLFDTVDYFVVNVSSPNTPNLRELQEKEPLTDLLNRLKKLNASKSTRKPILLKIAPDLTDRQLDDIIEIVKTTGIEGVIATNTTIKRNGLKTDAEKIVRIGDGGLSGRPLSKRSTDVIRYLAEKSNHAFPIIGVGGIHTPEDAIEKIEAGASLIQIYTGFIYSGPALIKKINKALLGYGKN